jgi:signal transduction histidine kinase
VTPGRRTRVGLAVTMVACLLAVASTNGRLAAAEWPREPLPVLILNSGNSTSVASQQLQQAIRHELAHSGVGPIEFFSEALEAYNLAHAIDDVDLTPFLAHKYAARPPQLVVAIGPQAVGFMQRQRRNLWRDARVVFAGVPLNIAMSIEDLDFPGVTFRTDAVQTLALAKRLVPRARRVLLVSGASEFDRLMARVTERELVDSKPALQIERLTGPTLEGLFAAVRALPPETVILYTTMFRDGAGQTFSSRELLERLTQVASVPIFTIYESYVGAGALGGAVTSWSEHGRSAGRLAAQALSGEMPVGNGMPVSGQMSCVLDSRALDRWNIAGSLVPSACDLRFATPTAWQAYRWWITSGVALGLAMLATGGLLLIQLQRRRRTDAELQEQRDELAHAARLAMIGELTASIAHEINQPLGAILNNADAAEMILESQPQRTDEVRRILADIRRDDLRASEVIRHIRTLLRKSGIEARRVAMNDVIGDVLRLIGPDAVRRGVAVTQDLARELPEVMADGVHLRQVVLNLVLNAMDAMKEIEPWQRRVSVRTARDGESIVVSVVDSGPGIAPERLPRVFDSFYTTKEDGLGLGLSIARYLVEANHGRLWAENAKGGGAGFHFSLPAAHVSRAFTSEVESAA